MGLVRMGPPQKLIKNLTQNFQIRNFVETGTYYGETSVWASRVFDRVLTIENSTDLYNQTIDKYGKVANIEFFLGDSRERLREIVSRLSEPTMFWLDAHWSGGLTYGKQDQCPILEEIDIINSFKLNAYIFIDDARLFLSPPQPPHEVAQWPNIVKILEMLTNGCQNRYVVITEDCIVAVPIDAKSQIVSYCQNVNTIAWEEYGKSLRTSDLKKGSYLIILDVSNKLRSIMRRLEKLSH